MQTDSVVREQDAESSTYNTHVYAVIIACLCMKYTCVCYDSGSPYIKCTCVCYDRACLYMKYTNVRYDHCISVHEIHACILRSCMSSEHRHACVHSWTGHEETRLGLGD